MGSGTRHFKSLLTWSVCCAHKALTIGIAINMVYGVADRALAYRVELPDDFVGDPFNIVTDQLTRTSQVC